MKLLVQMGTGSGAEMPEKSTQETAKLGYRPVFSPVLW